MNYLKVGLVVLIIVITLTSLKSENHPAWCQSQQVIELPDLVEYVPEYIPQVPFRLQDDEMQMQQQQAQQAQAQQQLTSCKEYKNKKKCIEKSNGRCYWPSGKNPKCKEAFTSKRRHRRTRLIESFGKTPLKIQGRLMARSLVRS